MPLSSMAQESGICRARDPNGPFANFCQTRVNEQQCNMYGYQCFWYPGAGYRADNLELECVTIADGSAYCFGATAVSRVESDGF